MVGTIPLTFTVNRENDTIICQRHSNSPMHSLHGTLPELN